jgi:hypothetical protein
VTLSSRVVDEHSIKLLWPLPPPTIKEEAALAPPIIAIVVSLCLRCDWASFSAEDLFLLSMSRSTISRRYYYRLVLLPWWLEPALFWLKVEVLLRGNWYIIDGWGFTGRSWISYRGGLIIPLKVVEALSWVTLPCGVIWVVGAADYEAPPPTFVLWRLKDLWSKRGFTIELWIDPSELSMRIEDWFMRRGSGFWGCYYCLSWRY